jgi:peptide/nickel transport system substrate-binding protein
VGIVGAAPDSRADTSSILSERVSKSASPESIADKPVGSGPYGLGEWRKGDELIMKANPYYHERGRPRTPELRIRYIRDDDRRIAALQSGDLDGIDFPPFSRIEELCRMSVSTA